MSNWLLIIFVLRSSVTFGYFPSSFLKCCFHGRIRFSWLAAFILALAMLFLLLTSFTVCQAIWDCLSSTESLILLIWSWMYSVCSFRYALVNSLCVFISFRALAIAGFLLLHRNGFFTSSAAACLRILTKFSYSSFGVSVSDIFWIASNLFLSVSVYLSLISLLSSRDQSLCVVMAVCAAFLRRLRCIFAVIIRWQEDTPSKEEKTSQFNALSTHFFFVRM